MRKLAVLRPENKSGLSHVLDLYFTAPEQTLEALSITIIDRDNQ